MHRGASLPAVRRQRDRGVQKKDSADILVGAVIVKTCWS